MKYDLTLKNNELLLQAMTWMNLTIMLSEKNPTKGVQTINMYTSLSYEVLN